MNPARHAAWRAVRHFTPRVIRRAWGRTVGRWLMSRAIAKSAKAGVVPPRAWWSLVGGEADFTEQGRWFFDFLVANSGVTPDSAVLDVGCGLGRHALHFGPYLSPGGSYRGFDIEPLRIRWCKEALTRRYPNFEFSYMPIRNEMYNASGGAQASDFRFPYIDQSFDLVFLASVFTHMLDAEVENYIREIARVLKPCGVCIATFYLLNNDRRSAIAAGPTAFTFRIAHAGSHIESRDPPEGAVAHEEARVRDMLAAAGLDLAGPIRLGSWDRSANQDQDFVISRKAA